MVENGARERVFGLLFQTLRHCQHLGFGHAAEQFNPADGGIALGQRAGFVENNVGGLGEGFDCLLSAD